LVELEAVDVRVTALVLVSTMGTVTTCAVETGRVVVLGALVKMGGNVSTVGVGVGVTTMATVVVLGPAGVVR
jgi:hypothetical protein